MRPKPTHLGPEYGAQFQDAAVAAAYTHRPPYPAEVIEVLAGLLVAPRTVLDVGTGRGEIARPLAQIAARVDAVDPSVEMVTRGRHLPGGDLPNLRWIVAPAETAPLDPPYGLITAASSLHWMEWSAVMPRFRAALAPDAVLAITGDGWLPLPWERDVAPVITRYSTNRLYQPYDLIAELESRGLIHRLGQRLTAPVPFAQPLDAYVESFHARNGLSRDRMPPHDAAAFDDAVRELVAPHAPDGIVPMQLTSRIVWGYPLDDPDSP
jgi:SAM-dependent methyltransferase